MYQNFVLRHFKYIFLYFCDFCVCNCSCFRLSSQVTEEDAIKASAKETASLEDQQLAEALAR